MHIKRIIKCQVFSLTGGLRYFKIPNGDAKKWYSYMLWGSVNILGDLSP